jgi:multidrug efflux system membrane fusion protein
MLRGMDTSEVSTSHDRSRGAGPFAAFATFVVSVTLLTSCARPAAQPAAPGLPQVTVAPAIGRDLTEWDEFTGRLEPVHSVDIRPRVSGLVSAVRFQEGAIVTRGDLLFTIDSRPFQAEVDRLRAELERARATVNRASSELARAERLTQENAISHEEHDRRAAFAQESDAQASAVEAALRAAELNLEFTHVTAPIDGRVGRAIVTEGNLVSSGPGEATLLTTLVSLDPIYASFDADEQAYLRYVGNASLGTRTKGNQKGTSIRMALADEADFPRKGEMNFLDNQIDAATGTIRGRAIFRNADLSLTPGLFVRIRLAATGSRAGVLIQDRAIGTDLDKRFVLVVGGDGSVSYRAVTLGPVIDGLRVVRTGVQAGDLVVINGLQHARPGMKVKAVTAEMDKPANGGVAAAGE